MKQNQFRTAMRSTVGAVILIPTLALAQSQGSQGETHGSQGSGSQGSGSQGTQGNSGQGTGTQGSSSRGSSAQGSQSGGSQGSSRSSGAHGSGSSSTSRSSGSASQSGATGGSQQSGMQQSGMKSGSSTGSSAARQSIDPAEVQRVFGSDVQIVDLQSLGPDQIRSVQQSLKDRGHYNGPIDGVYGAQTRAGVTAVLSQQYSMNQRLIKQGQIAGPLATSLGIQQSDISTVGGTDMRSGQQSPSMNGSQSTTRQGGSQRSGSSTSGSSSGNPSGSPSPGTGPSGTGPSGTGSSSPGTSSPGTTP